MIDDRNRELSAVLSYLVGRQLRTNEIVGALGVSRSTYYQARDEGRLISADNLLRLAEAFGLNPIDLLVRYRLVGEDAVIEYVGAQGAAPAVLTAAPARRRLQPRADLPPI